VIDESRIAEYADALVREPPPEPAIDPGSHFLNRGEETVAFFVTLDTINFGSGYFPHLAKQPGVSGYFPIAIALCDHFHK